MKGKERRTIQRKVWFYIVSFSYTYLFEFIWLLNFRVIRTFLFDEGIAEFWLRIFRNVPMLAVMIQVFV